ncbi:hypothetical protein N0V90_005016 [Kalmusia sp. IMI 367209]|nr:hypothetical protein N0V90_005016 [Kalmusia sp. IMI 367209]
MAPKYTAMSYSWVRDDTEHINDTDRQLFCDIQQEDAKTAIYKLEPASAELLRALRSSEDLVLWVDQICIDQRKANEYREPPFENIEKRRQIERMGDIYKYAASTTVWLGVDRSADASTRSQVKVATDMIPSVVSTYNAMAQNVPWEKSDHECLLHLFSRKWWKRTWTFQEVIKSQDIKFAIKIATPIGQEIVRLSWESLGTTILYISQRSIHPTPVQYTEDIHAAERKYLCWKFGREHRWPILQLLALFRPFDVSLAKDKIYGIESVVSESLGVDTAEELAQTVGAKRKIRLHIFSKQYPYPSEGHGWRIYQDFVTTFVEHTKSLKILSAVQHLDSAVIENRRGLGSDKMIEWQKNQPNPPFPSWVPNWFEKDATESFAEFTNAPDKPPQVDQFNACRYPHPGTAVLGVPPKNTLRVKGFLFGTVVHCAETNRGRSFDAAQNLEFEDLSPNLWADIPEFWGISEDDLDDTAQMMEQERYCHSRSDLFGIRVSDRFHSLTPCKRESYDTLEPRDVQKSNEERFV